MALVMGVEALSVAPPIYRAPISPEEAAKGHDCVTMYFELPVLLNVQWGTLVDYPKGMHEVPREWSDHPYLRENGARVYNKPSAPAGKGK